MPANPRRLQDPQASEGFLDPQAQAPLQGLQGALDPGSIGPQPPQASPGLGAGGPAPFDPTQDPRWMQQGPLDPNAPPPPSPPPLETGGIKPDRSTLDPNTGLPLDVRGQATAPGTGNPGPAPGAGAPAGDQTPSVKAGLQAPQAPLLPPPAATASAVSAGTPPPAAQPPPPAPLTPPPSSASQNGGYNSQAAPLSSRRSKFAANPGVGGAALSGLASSAKPLY